MPRVIVNADDFGLTLGVTEGIVRAHTYGIVTSTSLMVLAPAAEQAVASARAHPHLSVGLHFVEDRAEILDDRSALSAAFATQLARFRELTGREPTHVDSHHHVHMSRLAAFSALVGPLGIPLRGDGRAVYLGDYYGQTAPGETDLARVGRAWLLALLEANAHHELIELGCHPGLVTPELCSSYRDERVAELATLTSEGLREQLLERGFELVSFSGARFGATT